MNIVILLKIKQLFLNLALLFNLLRLSHKFYKSFDREKCFADLVIHGVSKPSSPTISQRIFEDKIVLEKILDLISTTISIICKLVSFGKEA